jgi:hypothetical protein
MHTAEEMGIDDFQASRSPDRKYYRTTPLKGLFVREKGGFYHDGRFATYTDVLAHYEKLSTTHFATRLADIANTACRRTCARSPRWLGATRASRERGQFRVEGIVCCPEGGC